ncbi:glycosyltransferase [Microbacterium sp. NPDC056234]|uniref:glycosyltransferase n=1 Tax=Microbacterium sp. NPDC056234 TaxID=3345757 RepID=UPI0035DB4062
MPLISFIIACGDDEGDVDRSLRSCLAQTFPEIEIVCVHSTQASPVTAAIADDPRISVLAQPEDALAAQLRRAGVEASRAPFVLFLDAGDTLDRGAAMRLRRQADDTQAQLIGYTIETTRADGKTTKSAPVAGPLKGADILRKLVPRETPAGLDTWRTLFSRELLRQAYAEAVDGGAALIDDRAVVLLAYACATIYASVDAVAYIHRMPVARTDAMQFGHALDRVDAFRYIEIAMHERARSSADPEPLLEAYTAGYLTAVADALSAFAALPAETRTDEQARLRRRIDELDSTLAAVAFAPEALALLAAHGERRELGQSPVRSVLLTTNVLTTGGVSGVLLTQARLLVGAGYRVTVATHRPGSAESLVPEGAALVQLTGTTRRQRVAQWAQLCRRHDVDVVIDHRILYSRDWPAFALAARSTGAATVGWVHNFAGRPTYNGNDLQSLLKTHLGALAHLVVLSPLDVAFWKLRGIPHVSYLPNPPSPFLLEAGATRDAKRAPQGRPLELVWWGRLEEHTKKVSQLVEVAASLERLGIDFQLRIVGPDWADMTADRLLDLAAKRGVADRVELTGPRHGVDLLATIDSSDVFVSTSIIEGYPLTLPEAQSRGLPIAMYDLPWLSLTQDNAGVVTTPQQDPDSLAAALADLSTDPQRYESMSRASVAAASRAVSFDFTQLYEQLLHGELPSAYSPEPTIEDGRKILELLVFFAEHSAPPPRAMAGRSPSRHSATPRRRAQPRTFGPRVEQKLTPIGHHVVDMAPWLRPVVSKVKRLLLHR